MACLFLIFHKIFLIVNQRDEIWDEKFLKKVLADSEKGRIFAARKQGKEGDGSGERFAEVL